MKALKRLALTLTLIGASTLPTILPAAAQPLQFQLNAAQQSAPQAAITLPQSTALLVAFPNETVVDVGSGSPFPITLPLAQPIYTPSGYEIVPANSPINLRVQPYDDGALLIAESVIVRGQHVPLQAQSSYLPGHTITHATAQQMARTNSAVFGNLSTAIAGAAGANLDQLQRAGFAGSAFGIISGLSSPQNIRIVRINPGSVHSLALQQPLTLSGPAQFAAAPAPSAQTAPAPATAPGQFPFRNSLEYSEFIEEIIDAYEAGEITREQGAQLIAAADADATGRLGLYPLAGLRGQVARHFGHIYSIDGDRIADAIVLN